MLVLIPHVSGRVKMTYMKTPSSQVCPHSVTVQFVAERPLRSVTSLPSWSTVGAGPALMEPAESLKTLVSPICSMYHCDGFLCQQKLGCLCVGEWVVSAMCVLVCVYVCTCDVCFRIKYIPQLLPPRRPGP